LNSCATSEETGSTVDEPEIVIDPVRPAAADGSPSPPPSSLHAAGTRARTANPASIRVHR
jgi:hypothetical protein